MTTFHPQTPSKCPPRDAVPSNGVYYRVVSNNPPTSDDFVISVLEPKNLYKLAEKIKNKDCSAFAISMFLTEKSALRVGDLFRRAMRGKTHESFLGLARVKLDENSGKLKQTGQDPNHHDLWPYINCKLECNVISVKGI